VARELCLNGQINTSGAGIFNIRMSFGDRTALRCPEENEVCCLHPDAEPADTDITKVTEPTKEIPVEPTTGKNNSLS
jgi:hypothetical protein